MRSKKIYIAYTGGTIGMKPTANGYAPVSGFFTQELNKLTELKDPQIPEFDVHEYPNLIDSANIVPDDWNVIGEDILANYEKYDGFIVIHGTDTMAYTASALSFMLEGLGKPVILTGSQIPLMQLRSDARENLVGALFLAAHYPIPEVCVYFHNRLYRGNRSKKVDSNGFSAFQSPNFSPLIEVGADISILTDQWITTPQQHPLNLSRLQDVRVGTLTFFPGVNAQLVNEYLQQDLQGLVLLTYGMGNAPINNQVLMSSLKAASQRGVVIVNCSQCLKGQVNMEGYEAGKKLQDCGIISGKDMTLEATLTKLSYLLSNQNLKQSEIQQRLITSLRGELTK